MAIGLMGKGLDERDLAIGEWSDGSARNRDHTYYRPGAQERHREN
jgi:hypothetical protein